MTSGAFLSYDGVMPLYDIAFYYASFFLAGAAFAGLGANPKLILFAVVTGIVVMAATGFIKKSAKCVIFSGLLLAVPGGFFYYHFYFAWQGQVGEVGSSVEVVGVVASYPEWRLGSQRFDVDLKEPDRGRVSVLASAYPRFMYGDVLRMRGTREAVRPGLVRMAFPVVEKIGHEEGSRVKRFLFAWREHMVGTFQRVLSPGEAALLAGLTFGDRAGFSKEFQEALQKSGTTHIVALSGQNIALVVSLVGVLCAYVFSRRASFFVSIGVIMLFVTATGAEASAVRAAIMGVIALLALHVGRLYSFRNAITFAAFFMVLANPRVLVFDIGFQLSFAALLGIVYLLPAMKTFFGISKERGLLGWRENALASSAAQLAVLPIILKYFGAFSLLSLPANVMILEVVPILTILGFLLGFLGYISGFLSTLLGMGVHLLLGYVVGIIHFFSRIALPLSFPASNSVICVYYLFLVGFVWYVHHRAKEKMKPI